MPVTRAMARTTGTSSSTLPSEEEVSHSQQSTVSSTKARGRAASKKQPTAVPKEDPKPKAPKQSKKKLTSTSKKKVKSVETDSDEDMFEEKVVPVPVPPPVNIKKKAIANKVVEFSDDDEDGDVFDPVPEKAVAKKEEPFIPPAQIKRPRQAKLKNVEKEPAKVTLAKKKTPSVKSAQPSPKAKSPERVPPVLTSIGRTLRSRGPDHKVIPSTSKAIPSTLETSFEDIFDCIDPNLFASQCRMTALAVEAGNSVVEAFALKAEAFMQNLERKKEEALQKILMKKQKEIQSKAAAKSPKKSEQEKPQEANVEETFAKLEIAEPVPSVPVKEVEVPVPVKEIPVPEINVEEQESNEEETETEAETKERRVPSRKRSRSKSIELFESSMPAANKTFDFDFQEAADNEIYEKPTKRIILEANIVPAVSVNEKVTTIVTSYNTEKPSTSSASKTFCITKTSAKAGDATYVKPALKQQEPETKATTANETEKKRNDFTFQIEINRPPAARETENVEELFESSNMSFEDDEEEQEEVVQQQTEKRSMNETVSVKNPQFLKPNLPPPSSVKYGEAPSRPALGLEVLEEEGGAPLMKTFVKNAKKGPVLVDVISKDEDNSELFHSMMRSKDSTSSSSSSCSSSSSFKSASSHVSQTVQIKSTVSKTEVPKKDFMKNLEREKEAQRKKEELLRHKQEVQKKKNDEWKLKAEKMLQDKEKEKAEKEKKAGEPIIKPKVIEKPTFKVTKQIFSKGLETGIKNSGPMKFKSPSNNSKPTTSSLFSPIFKPQGLKPPLPAHQRFEEEFKNNSILDVTADSTFNSYDITRYEDLDEDLKHREFKKIPSWAENRVMIAESLAKQIPLQVFPYTPIGFPKSKPRYKLY